MLVGGLEHGRCARRPAACRIGKSLPSTSSSHIVSIGDLRVDHHPGASRSPVPGPVAALPADGVAIAAVGRRRRGPPCSRTATRTRSPGRWSPAAPSRWGSPSGRSDSSAVDAVALDAQRPPSVSVPGGRAAEERAHRASRASVRSSSDARHLGGHDLVAPRPATRRRDHHVTTGVVAGLGTEGPSPSNRRTAS